MRTSGLRRLDPRPKMALMASASTACMLTRDPAHLSAILGLLVLILLVGGADPASAWRRTRAILPLVIFLFLIQAFFARPDGADARPLLSIGDLVLVREGGLLLAAVLSLRLLIIVLAALVLLEGEIRDYLLALIHMKTPYEIAFMVIVGIHFLPILRDEAIHVHCYMQLRGKDFKKIGLPRKLRAYAGLCLPILVGALRRAEETSVAMSIRGFRARPGRTYMRRLDLRATDIFLIVLWPVIFVALHFLFRLG